MLRSMIIGLAIAALLQVGARTVASTDMTLAAKRIDWVQVQTNALAHMLCNGITLGTR